MEVKPTILTLKFYDSFHPRRLLEKRQVEDRGNGVFYDPATKMEGFTLTGRTFRSSPESLAEFKYTLKQ